MPPKGTRRKRKQGNKVQNQQARRGLENLQIGSSSTTPEPQPSTSSDQAPTNVLMSKYPLYDQWETMEEEERQRVRDSHASQVGPLGFRPNYLPVRIHIAAPQQGRFTREVESSMIDCNTLEAVKDIAKSSLVFELVRTNIDPARARFAGLVSALFEVWSMKRSSLPCSPPTSMKATAEHDANRSIIDDLWSHQ
jgi:hypothetical protein